jgi:hypothetical protein
MEHLDIDWQQFTAIARKMRAIHVADLNISAKRATPHKGGLFIKPEVRCAWHDFFKQDKE